jgi:adenine-specific DNA-methyltransferase
MLALDECESTLGHFSSYLHRWSRRSYQPMRLRVPDLFESDGPHIVRQMDIFALLPEVEVDLAYFDPPYGSANEKMPPSRVRYSAYYHLWKTVVLNDRPEIFGKVGRRKDSSDALSYSPFEDFRKNDTGRYVALDAVERALNDVRARFVLLSYSSGGRATADEILRTIRSSGKLIRFVEIDHKKNVMAEMKWTHAWASLQEPHREYLFLMEK